MTAISSKKIDFLDMYVGFNAIDGGLGSISPNIYASDAYRKKKVSKILIGTINRIVYIGFEHDVRPLVLIMAYEPKYHTIIGFNLSYLPEVYRRAILKLVLKSNKTRIKKQNPLIVNYSMIKRAIPASVGAVRRYKVIGVRVLDTYRLSEWDETIQYKSKWQNMYKDKKKAKTSRFDYLDKIFTRFKNLT